MGKRKVDLSKFKVECRYIQDSLESEKERFRCLIQLIFPHLSSAKDLGTDKLLENVESEEKP